MTRIREALVARTVQTAMRQQTQQISPFSDRRWTVIGALRTASILHWIVGAGWGIPGVFGICKLAMGQGSLLLHRAFRLMETGPS